MSFLGIIPARFASSRFPGKPLVDMLGKPMIQRVYEQVVGVLDDVCVATDDKRILKVVESFGGKVVMTSENHRSGTDRCYEAYTKMGKEYDVVINIQGDEPFIKPSQLRLLQSCFNDPKTQIATLVKPYDSETAYDVLADPNTPKVVLNRNMQALYFSRSIIPFVRGKDFTKWSAENTYYKHIGLYAYKTDILKEITLLPQSSLEKAESLEQLRWLENGYFIKVAVTAEETIGIDTPEDLKKALILLGKQ